MNETIARIERARWWALTDHPFYGSLAMGLVDVMDPSVKTAATDGRQIRWSPDWVATLTDEQVRFVLLHETLHCAHQHPWRLPCDARGNKAGDYEINLVLQKVAGCATFPNALLDQAYAGLACEEILARLPEESGGSGGNGQPGQDNGQSDDGSDCGSFESPAPDAQPGSGDQPGNGAPSPDDAPGNAPSNAPASLQDLWGIRVMQAAMAAAGRGTVPADMERELERLRTQTLDWRREMSDFVREAGAGRNDWARAARRHATAPVLYPRRRPDDLGLVIFARDTSGSIDAKLCSEFSALGSDAVAETGCRALVMDIDARIQAEYWLEPGDEFPVKAVGGGGTDFRPVFARAAELIEQGERIAGLVYLTDLAGAFPESCDIPTLWVATSDDPVPFGRVVRVR